MVLKPAFAVSDADLESYIATTRAENDSIVPTAPVVPETPRAPSGLGFVKHDNIPKQDILPSRARHGRIRLYISEMRGDSFYIWVPFDLPVLPPPPEIDRFDQLWGNRFGAASTPREKPSLAGLIEALTGVKVEDQRLFSGSQRLMTPGRTLSSYCISTGQTIKLYTKARRDIHNWGSHKLKDEETALQTHRRTLFAGAKKENAFFIRSFQGPAGGDDALRDSKGMEEKAKHYREARPSPNSSVSFSVGTREAS
jgi:hypothetical protein